MKKFIMSMILVLTLLFSTVTSFAATETVTLVNPVNYSVIYSNNLLISVKITQPVTIRVQVFEKKQMVNGTLSAINVEALSNTKDANNLETFPEVSKIPAATYQSKNNLSFYTKKVTDLTPGIYKIQVDTLDANNKKVNEIVRYVAVKQKTEDEAKILDSPQSGTMQFLQNLLKTIFGE